MVDVWILSIAGEGNITVVDMKCTGAVKIV